MSSEANGTPQYLVAPPARARNTLVGTSFASALVLMYFGALIAIYLSERADVLRSGGTWIPSGTSIMLAAPSVVLWTLLFSIGTIQWAVYSTARNDRRHLLLALGLTALFGVAVINQFFFMFRQMALEIDGGSKMAPLTYTILGSFLAAVVAALIFLLVAGIRSLSGETTKPNTPLIVSAAFYWDSLVLIYFIIWLAIFVTK